MEDVAKTAFLSHKYDLAAQIYASVLVEHGNNDQELCLCLADALVRSGKLNESVDAYLRATRIGHVSPERLVHLVTGIVDTECKHLTLFTRHRKRDRDTPSDLVSCSMCNGLIHEPVTIPCGHTYCKQCVSQKQKSQTCGLCSTHVSNIEHSTFKINVGLSRVFEKLFSEETRSRRIRAEGNRLFADGQLQAALDKYTEAITLVPTEHLLFSNRSHVYATQGKLQEALVDANEACKLKPAWPKGYYRKATALIGLGRYQDAGVTLLLCLAVDHNYIPAKRELARVLHHILSPASSGKERPEQSSITGDLNSQHIAISETIYTMIQMANSEVDKLNEAEFTSFKNREIDMEKIDKDDFECSLCFRLLYAPVTTPCGHMFCCHCLDRCLDHSNRCPLCKDSLIEYLAERRKNITVVMEKLIKMIFPNEYEERKKLHDSEMEALANISEIPVFVCTLALPSIVCPLHIFEPRYRLMVRQCMETGARQFGMCLPNSDENGFVDYGCMLEIRDVQHIPDGRSIVDCIGGRRFKVLERGMRDGYHTAKVVFIKDAKVEDEDELQQLKSLHLEVYEESAKWFNGLNLIIKHQIRNHLGNMPACDDDPQEATHGPKWTWWLLGVLPLDSNTQMAVLSTTTLKERLIALRRALNDVSSQGS
uniref:LON peptidase N-terminal domain and RING finger protein 3-like n=1 Tax=Saccoglossus kowalevskii TaxID=10224 RepID=A0ABM0M9B3_SACKO|nr:PREDICTED: LON peptidase N-terminal domain and RING finger protein 3-like [Saccoglossus kowalevskii]